MSLIVRHGRVNRDRTVTLPFTRDVIIIGRQGNGNDIHQSFPGKSDALRALFGSGMGECDTANGDSNNGLLLTRLRFGGRGRLALALAFSPCLALCLSFRGGSSFRGRISLLGLVLFFLFKVIRY